MTLARLLRAGELTAVWVPDEEHEAIRDVVRARRQAKDDLVSAKLALRSFLLRHERRFPGRSAWNKTYWRWLGEQAFASPHQQLVFGEHLRRIEEAQARCDRLDAALAEAVAGWRLAPLVEALQALRGIALVVAATLVAEIGDLGRFETPKQLMSWLGLVPSEQSSGARVRRGAITKTGNGQARTMLVEASWCYRLPAREEQRYRAAGSGAAGGDQEHRVARAGAAVRALPEARSGRQAAAEGDHGDRARTRRIRVGHRASGPARRGRPSLTDNAFCNRAEEARGATAIATWPACRGARKRWEILDAQRGRPRRRCPTRRPRAAHDERRVMRWPIRG